MFYTEEIKVNDAAALLKRCGLSVPRDVDYTAGVFVMEKSGCGIGVEPVACGSLKGDMIQGVAVDPQFQGEDLTGVLMTHLFKEAAVQDRHSLYLFTKPDKTQQFRGLGFRPVVTAQPYAALLEWGATGVRQYMERLSQIRRKAEQRAEDGLGRDYITGTEKGSCVLVMNANPFTCGHRFLIEYAAARHERVYVLVVEEDVSLFSFDERMEMLERGTADLPSVHVLAGGRYVVSDLTFPSYFTKEENLAAAHAAMDAEIFAACIAPALSADIRYIGTEPESAVTGIYNKTLKERLPRRGISVVEVPRLCANGEAVSASRVRGVLLHLFRHGRLTADAIVGNDMLAGLLPASTLACLREEAVLRRLAQSFEEQEKENEMERKNRKGNPGSASY